MEGRRKKLIFLLIVAKDRIIMKTVTTEHAQKILFMIIICDSCHSVTETGVWKIWSRLKVSILSTDIYKTRE